MPFVSGLEPFKFEIDGDQAAKLAVIEEQIDIEIFAIDDDPLLPGHVGESDSELKYEVFHLSENRGFEIFLLASNLAFPGEEGQQSPVQNAQVRQVARQGNLADQLGLVTCRTPSSKAQTIKQRIVRRGIVEEASIVICSRLASPWSARSSTSEGTNSMPLGGRKKRLIDYASCAG